MDFLVDMTTHVPPGTSPDTVEDIRAHDSAASEFLTALTITVPPGTSTDEVDDRSAREAVRANGRQS